MATGLVKPNPAAFAFRRSNEGRGSDDRAVHPSTADHADQAPIPDDANGDLGGTSPIQGAGNVVECRGSVEQAGRERLTRAYRIVSHGLCLSALPRSDWHRNPLWGLPMGLGGVGYGAVPSPTDLDRDGKLSTIDGAARDGTIPLADLDRGADRAVSALDGAGREPVAELRGGREVALAGLGRR